MFDRLPPSEQRALEPLARDPESYGILRPRSDSRLTVKSVSRETALLWYTLQTPGRLPGYVAQALGERCDQVIGQMVLDGIFGIEDGDRTLYGPSAQAVICPKGRGIRNETALAALSRRALEYAEALGLADAAALSTRLYLYNHVPVSLRRLKLLPDRNAVERHLGIRDGAMAHLLKQGWTRVAYNSPAPQPWIAWQRENAADETGPNTGCKLYVSPVCNQVSAAFQATARIAAASRAFYLKVGSDAHGLLRPDKIVLYFRRFPELQETAARLLKQLEPCAAQGVPFTAELGGSGLLSWGVDPPAGQHNVAWLDRESWRLRICNRLAGALVVARASGTFGESAIIFALERLRLEGVDTDTWSPTRELSWTTNHP